MNGTETHPLFRILVAALVKATGLAEKSVASQLRPPPDAKLGDYAFPCFEWAKSRKAAPPAAAQELAGLFAADSEYLQRFEAPLPAGPFLNFRALPGALCASVLGQVRSHHQYGSSEAGAGKTIIVDYSGPNFAKPFHVGHLMSTVLGASLVRILRYVGYKVVGVNHLGDWGTQCGFLFSAWLRADAGKRDEELRGRGIDYLLELYIGINTPAKRLNELEAMLLDKNIATHPDERAKIEAELAKLKPEVVKIDEEARAMFRRLEEGDREIVDLWERFRETSLEVLQRAYDRLDIKFESTAGEAFYTPLLKPMIEDWKAKGILKQSEGAWVIPLSAETDKKKRPPCIVVKSDGGTKYDTRDLAAAIYRKKEYDFYKNLYVVDVRQAQHFDGIFTALEKAGYNFSKDCVHVSYGLMQIKESGLTMPMTTRGGQMVPLMQVLDTMVEIVRKIVAEKNPDLNEQQRKLVAEAVGVGAIVFWIQSRRRNSNIVFDLELATNSQGDTGPYVQYTHARACSILRSSQNGAPARADLTLLVEPEETKVAKVLEGFPKVVHDAAESYEPSLVTTWVLELCHSFNDFYNKCPVLKSPGPLQDARLVLVDAVRLTLTHALKLLGMTAPGEM